MGARLVVRRVLASPSRQAGVVGVRQERLHSQHLWQPGQGRRLEEILGLGRRLKGRGGGAVPQDGTALGGCAW